MVQTPKEQRDKLTKIINLPKDARHNAEKELDADDMEVYKNMKTMLRRSNNIKSATKSRRNKQKLVEKLQTNNTLLVTFADAMAAENVQLKQQLQAVKQQLQAVGEHTSRMATKMIRAYGVANVQAALSDQSHWSQNSDPNDVQCY